MASALRRLFLLLSLPLALNAQDFFDWRSLPPLPEPLGAAGPFVAGFGDRLLVAGGAHFEVSPFQGGTKQWIARAWLYEGEKDVWTSAPSLPRPLAYGASVATPDGAIWVGGSDADRHYGDVTRVRLTGLAPEFEDLPPLPEPAANHAAALFGATLYVAGGQATPDSTQAFQRFWALDLAEDGREWRELEAWPGPGRILPVMVALDDGVYLASGAELLPDGRGVATRRFLADAYRYHPETGWKAVADPPRPFVAAPAAAWGGEHLFVFGGDDGSLFFDAPTLGENHPGFTHQVLDYHSVTDTWTSRGEMPFSHVTTTALQWQGGVLVASGEDRPGHRSPAVFRGVPAPREAHFRTLDYAALIVYLGALVAIGLYFSRREATTEDFFLAGRRAPWWAAGLSIYGTQLSSISFIAIPAKVYSTDWVYLLVQLSIVLVAFPVVWFYLPHFRRVKMTSAYEYLETRFDGSVRLFASASFVLFQLGRMAIVLFLPAIALSTVTGIGVFPAILVMGVLATVYTALGGIEAVIWTDVVQVVVLLGGAVLALVVAVSHLDGGLSALFVQAAAAEKLHVFNWTWDYTSTAVWVVLLGNLFNNLIPYTSDQAVVQRYLTTRTEQEAARGIWVNAALIPFSTLVLFTLGTALWAFYRQQPESLIPGQPTDSIFPLFIAQQLPVGLAGVVIAAVFAASMSTLDSSMNSVATALTKDWYERFRPAAQDADKLRLARGLTMGLGAAATGVSLALATFDVGSLWDTFQAAMGLFGGGLAGLFALGIFTRRANAPGALVGAIASVFVLAWVQRATEAHFFLYGMVGIGTCFVVGYAASRAIGAKPAH